MQDPWFTYYRGRGKMQVTPRNAKGWAAMIAFILVVTAPSFFIGPLSRHGIWVIVPYLVLIAIVSVAFVRFAIAKSERVDLDMSAKELEEFRAWKRRGKR